MKTTGTKIIVRPEAKEVERTAGGLIIPETSSMRKPSQGKVVAIGPKVESIKIDDSVKYHQGVGTEIEVKGEAFLVMQELEVLTID